MKEKRNGFTLIELIVTIMLLAIIVLIALPSINGLLDKNKQNSCDSLKRSIMEATKMYASDNRYELKNKTEVTVSDLNDYFNKKVENPCDSSDINDYSEEIKVQIKRDSKGNLTYTLDSWPSKFDCCTQSD